MELFQRGRILMLGTVPELAREVLGAGFVVDVEATAAPGKDLVPRLAAIPGVIFYNMFARRIGNYNGRMNNFVGEFSTVLSRHFDRGGKA